MKLRKCLKITKSSKFSIFVYPKGHIKEQRGIDELPIKIIEVERNKNGKLPKIEFEECKVKEIIPSGYCTTIVVEIDNCDSIRWGTYAR